MLLSEGGAGDLAAIAAGCGALAYLPKQGSGRDELLQGVAARARAGPARATAVTMLPPAMTGCAVSG